MQHLRRSILLLGLLLVITSFVAFGQTVYSTGTQGCCGIVDPHYTLVAAPTGVTLGNVYSTLPCCGRWVTPLPGSSWINPTGTVDWDAPIGNYTYRQTFTLTSTAGAQLTGEWSSDNQSCISLNGGPTQCTQGGSLSYYQYTPFLFTEGFQVGTNTLDIVVYNDGGPTGLLIEVSGPATEKKLHNFGSGMDGKTPYASLIWDAAGNLYGTTSLGGVHGAGTVFEMTPNQSGGWTEKVLHNFGEGMDGQKPYGNLIWDADGKLYGTTESGGVYAKGTVFELSPNGSGGWTEKVLHNFGLYTGDGASPNGGVVWDASGRLYGTTLAGGHYDAGTVFRLIPNGSGGWAEHILHNFGSGKDGQSPKAGLVRRSGDTFYGTTSAGGAYDKGTVFEITRNDDGSWTETIRHNFGLYPTDGVEPVAGLILDASGNLYGTTNSGGGQGFGTVFEVLTSGTEKILHNFGTGMDGRNPKAGLVMDTGGNLYGTTYAGGVYGKGTVFMMFPGTNGKWIEETRHNFGMYSEDGIEPCGSLIFDSSGNLYGTTVSGANFNGGTVFELMP